jgi:hypothetical protein
MALDVSRLRTLGVSSRYLTAAAWLVVGALAVLHYVIVWRCSVNVPYWDEWEAFGGAEQLPQRLSLSWLLTQHNEHRIVFTRLQTWLLFQLNGWDIATQIRMNFAIFLGMVGFFTYMIHRAVPATSGWFLALCFLSQVTDLAGENHLWGFQSQFHITLLGLMLSVYLLFRRHLGWIRLAVGVAVLIFSIYSFSAGLPGSAVVILVFVLFRFLVWKDQRTTSLLREVLMVGGAVFAWATAVKFYLHDHSRSSIAMVLPNDPLFWDHYSNLLSLGFGFTRVASLQSIVSTVLVLATVSVFSLSLLRRKTRVTYSDAFVQVFTISLVILAALATISIGRAGFGLSNAKSSRYAEIASLLVPCVAALWLGGTVRWKKLGLTMAMVTALIAVVGMRNNFRFISDYPNVKEQREVGLRCVGETLKGGASAGACPELYPVPIEDRIQYAESRGASFISEAKRLSMLREMRRNNAP